VAAGLFIFCDARRSARRRFSESWNAGEEIDSFRRLKRLARREERAIVISTAILCAQHRKLRLYGSREFSLHGEDRRVAGRTLRSAEDCFVGTTAGADRRAGPGPSSAFSCALDFLRSRGRNIARRSGTASPRSSSVVEPDRMAQE